jgi:hypothetical protein
MYLRRNTQDSLIVAGKSLNQSARVSCISVIDQSQIDPYVRGRPDAPQPHRGYSTHRARYAAYGINVVAKEAPQDEHAIAAPQ